MNVVPGNLSLSIKSVYKTVATKCSVSSVLLDQWYFKGTSMISTLYLYWGSLIIGSFPGRGWTGDSYPILPSFDHFRS